MPSIMGYDKGKGYFYDLVLNVFNGIFVIANKQNNPCIKKKN